MDEWIMVGDISKHQRKEKAKAILKGFGSMMMEAGMGIGRASVATGKALSSKRARKMYSTLGKGFMGAASGANEYSKRR